GQRPHARLRAARSLRRPRRLRNGLARGRHRGAGRVLGSEDRVRQPRSRGRLMARAVALVPARSGSQRVVAKNLRALAGHPLLPQPEGATPYHSSQYQSLPRVYIQNSSLEIAWAHVLEEPSIAGRRVAPFLTEGLEGFSIDYPDDLERAERLAAEGEPLPEP